MDRDTFESHRSVGLTAVCFSSQAQGFFVRMSKSGPEAAQEFAAKHGIPAAYESAAAMFRNEKLDAVSIVTTDATHAAMALLSIRHGVHVMCEKPLAANLRDAKKMAAAAK